MNRIIIDTDTGVDDAQAMLLAFAHKNTKVEAITSVSGNVNVKKTTANILKVLDVVGKNIPVFPGCALPLIDPPKYAAFVHGEDGLGDSGIPASKRIPEDKHAVHALIDLANANPGELSIIALGPLTNIAVATMLDPGLPNKIKELTIMGGAVSGKGNANVNSEFNVFFDPEAARIVFDRWPMVRVLDWEVTVAAGIPRTEVDSLMKIDSPKAEFFRKITTNTLKFLKKEFKMDVLFVPDGLATAAAIEPSIIKRKEVRHLTVELTGKKSRGLTVVDWFGMGGETPNAEIVMEIDQRKFMNLMVKGLS